MVCFWGVKKGDLLVVIVCAGGAKFDLLRLATKASNSLSNSLRLRSLAVGMKLRPLFNKDASAAV